tara:strand:+ start:210 stop:353 length:144 start_codon:yes stop_codon:yes gene_type:complete
MIRGGCTPHTPPLISDIRMIILTDDSKMMKSETKKIKEKYGYYGYKI